MRNLSLTILLLLITTASLSAQSGIKYGFKLDVLSAYNRVLDDSPFAEFSQNNNGVSFIIGPTLELPIGESTRFATGLWFASRGTGIRMRVKSLGEVYEEDFRIQTLALPLTIKWYGSELKSDLRPYFTGGLVTGFKLNETGRSDSELIVTRFNGLHFSTLAQAGLDYRLSVKTFIYAGLSFQYGLSKANGDSGQEVSFRLKQHGLGLNLGLRF